MDECFAVEKGSADNGCGLESNAVVYALGLLQSHIVPIFRTNLERNRRRGSIESYGREFTPRLKKKIKQRDGHRCVACSRTYELVIHHIDANKQNSSPDNLQTVCRWCHAEIHQFWLSKGGMSQYDYITNTI